MWLDKSGMDPPVMMNGSAFRSGNAASLCNLAEIWPFPINLSGTGGGAAAASYTLGQLADSAAAYANRDLVVDDPMVLDQRGVMKKRREDDEASKAGVSTSTPNNAMNDCDSKRLKTDENPDEKAETEANSGKPGENSTKPAEPPKQDYIHVRARRGQATDSHSLAERARREKISERMKILQDLVPGCNKVVGKALVLDEIINYIQSLQRQVEFLSMKLEAVTSRTNPSTEGFPSKDFGQQAFDMGGAPFGSQSTRDFSRGSSPEWLHMQIGGSFERTT